MILVADTEGPDQSDLGLRFPHKPENTFWHGVAQVISH